MSCLHAQNHLPHSLRGVYDEAAEDLCFPGLDSDQKKNLLGKTDCGLGSNETADPCIKALLHLLLKHISFKVVLTIMYQSLSMHTQKQITFFWTITRVAMGPCCLRVGYILDHSRDACMFPPRMP